MAAPQLKAEPATIAGLVEVLASILENTDQDVSGEVFATLTELENLECKSYEDARSLLGLLQVSMMNYAESCKGGTLTDGSEVLYFATLLHKLVRYVAVNPALFEPRKVH